MRNPNEMAATSGSSENRSPQDFIVAWGVPVLIFFGLALVYSLGVSRPATFDELYHVLAARGWLDHGAPVIAEGTYERARWFTWLVSLCFHYFGESLAAARIPAILPMAFLGAIVFAWTRNVVGTAAAWITTLLYGLSPFAVEISVFIRFYSLQCLAFFIAAICLYRIIHGQDSWSRIALAAVGAVLALVIATYFQDTTLIGIVGLGLWLGSHIITRWLTYQRIPRTWRIGAVIVGLILSFVILAALFTFGIVDHYIEQYRSTPYFNRSTADQVWYYHYWINLYFPTLWPVMPLLTLIAFASHPRVTLFAATIFAVALILHSFAASKGLRYMAYAMPFLFILLGTGLSVFGALAVKGLTSLEERLATHFSWSGMFRGLLSRAAIVVALGFIVIANTGFLRSAFYLAAVTVPPEKPNEDWSAALDFLRTDLQSADVIITGNETETLYYLGDFDVIWGASRLSELHDTTEFSRDPRTGRPIISTASSLQQLQACYPQGLFVVSMRRWDDIHFPETEIPFRDTLLETSETIELPANSRVLAYRWNQPDLSTESEVCEMLDDNLAQRDWRETADNPS